MTKGGRRSTTWKPSWKSGKTTVIRVPEVLAEELLRIARRLDEGEALPVTVNSDTGDNSHVTSDSNFLKEAADTFFITISPRYRRDAKRFLYGFLKEVEKADMPCNRQ
jgi:hypothetical protein